MSARPFPIAVLRRGAESAAEALLGAVLVHETRAGRIAGRIVETEAYLGANDPASHSARGRTPRNAAMFAAAGTAYVYRIYGLHLCLNVVTGAEGVGEAVLLRALRPLDGIGEMRAQRGVGDDRRLCDGPGKLCQALGVTAEHDGVRFGERGLALFADERPRGDRGESRVARGPRVGITRGAELPLRFRLAPVGRATR